MSSGIAHRCEECYNIYKRSTEVKVVQIVTQIDVMGANNSVSFFLTPEFS
jgi:hypothetical protein